jgi:hypothetical protein
MLCIHRIHPVEASMATFSTKILQDLADALSEARGEEAVAMATPKNTERLNAARANRTRLEARGKAGGDYEREGLWGWL